MRIAAIKRVLIRLSHSKVSEIDGGELECTAGPYLQRFSNSVLSPHSPKKFFVG